MKKIIALVLALVLRTGSPLQFPTTPPTKAVRCCCFRRRD